MGKQVRAIHETGQTVTGPSQLIKVYFGAKGDDPEADDEVTVSYWGVRAGRSGPAADSR
jgi:hypothetical protein